MRLFLVVLGAWWLEILTIPSPPSNTILVNQLSDETIAEEQNEHCEWLGVCDEKGD